MILSRKLSFQRDPSSRLRAWSVVLVALASAAAFGVSCGSHSPAGGTTGTDGGAGSSAGGAGGTTDTGGAGTTDTAGAGGTSDSGGTGGAMETAGAGGATGGAGAGGVTGAAGTGGAAGAGAARPNIIFLLSDDLSMNLVQYMPHVLQMQKDGASFDNYFVSDSLCCPSRTSMMTGKYPHNSGVFTNSGDDGGYATYLSHGNDPQTFAVALQTAGYRTAMMGKFLNGYDPTLNQASMGWGDWAVAGDGYPEFNYDLNQNGTIVHYAKAPADYLTDVLSGLGQTFVKRVSPKPFLLEVATFAPHAPYIPAPRDSMLFPGLMYPRTPAFNARPTATAPAWLQAIPALKAPGIAAIDLHYRMRVQAVQAFDDMIGALQAALKASGHDKDTYLVFSSDNGYHMGERSQPPGKMTAYDTDIHVPLVVTGPGVPAGLKIEQFAQNIDLCPTFAELAQTAPPATINGHSLAALIHGETVADWRNVALIEHHDPKFDPTDPDADTDVVKNPPTYNALRTLTTTYVEYVGGETEFHDRTTDPLELDNTAASLTPAQVTKLHDAITAIKTCQTAAACWTAQHFTP